MIAIYFIVIVLTVGSLQLVADKSFFGSTFKRTIAGSTISTASYGWLSVYSGFESYLRSAINGDFGNGGYFMAASLLALLSVWVWNIIVTRKFIVR